MSVSLRARRIVLRILVLVQLAALVLVASTIRNMVVAGVAVLPGAVLLVTAMLAATAVALRATFRRSERHRGHRFMFMAAEVAVLLLPLTARASIGIVAGSEDTGILAGMLGLELLAASCIAAVAALLAPVLLAPPDESTADSPYAKALAGWALAAIVVTAAVTTGYRSHFNEVQSPASQLAILFAGDSPEDQRDAAVRLVASRHAWTPGVREALRREAGSGKVDEKVWASYVLVASGQDDGRGMKALRSLMGGFATIRVVDVLAMLGPASAPALPELAKSVENRTRDELDAAIQLRAAEALGAIGPPAIETVPSLYERARETDYPNLCVEAAHAIDRIDPAFAKRCVAHPTMLAALASGTEITLAAECKNRGLTPN